MKTAHFLSKDVTTSQDLSAAALDYSTSEDFTRERKVEMILFNFSVAVSETITITLDSGNGSDYDTILQEVVLIAETDFVYRPQGQLNIQSGDAIKLECTNTGGVGTCFATIKTSEM